MDMNHKLVSLAVTALVVLSVFTVLISIAPPAEAAKKTTVVITVSTSDNSLTGPVANNAKLKLQGTGRIVAFTATEQGTWGVTYPAGVSTVSNAQSRSIDTSDIGVYSVDFTKQGSSQPDWSATITVVEHPNKIYISTGDHSAAGTVDKGANINLPVTAAPVTFTATEQGTWDVTYPAGVSAVSNAQSRTLTSLMSGVYTIEYSKVGSTKPSWSATLTVPFSVSISTSDGSLSGPISNNAELTLPATAAPVTFTATEQGTWDVTYPAGVSAVSNAQSRTLTSLMSGTYSVTFTKEASSEPDWSVTITVT